MWASGCQPQLSCVSCGFMSDVFCRPAQLYSSPPVLCTYQHVLQSQNSKLESPLNGLIPGPVLWCPGECSLTCFIPCSNTCGQILQSSSVRHIPQPTLLHASAAVRWRYLAQPTSPTWVGALAWSRHVFDFLPSKLSRKSFLSYQIYVQLLPLQYVPEPFFLDNLQPPTWGPGWCVLALSFLLHLTFKNNKTKQK